MKYRFVKILLVFTSLHACNSGAVDFSELVERSFFYSRDYLQFMAEMDKQVSELTLQAYSAYPKVDLELNKNLTNSDVTGPRSITTSNGSYRTDGLTLRINQPIYDQEIISQMSSAEKKIYQLQHEVLLKRIAHIKAVFQQYKTYVLYRKKIPHYEADLEYGRYIYHQTEGLASQGLVSNGILAESKIEMSSKYSQLADAQHYLSQSEASLIGLVTDVVMLAEPDCITLSKKYLSYKVPENPMSNSVELSYIRTQILYQKDIYEGVKSAIVPKVYANYSYSVDKQIGGSFDNSLTKQGVVQISLSVPLYDRASPYKKIQSQTEHIAQLESMYDKYRMIFPRELRKTLDNIEESYQSWLNVNNNDHLLERYLALKQNEYEIGAIKKADYLSAKVLVEKSKVESLNSCLNFYDAAINLYALLGQGDMLGLRN